jgi:hypothetical protein
MPLLFSYGTLQRRDVQLATFGRLLQGEPDELAGFEPSLVKIEDPVLAAEIGRTHHANVTFNGRKSSRVSGTVFEIAKGNSRPLTATRSRRSIDESRRRWSRASVSGYTLTIARRGMCRKRSDAWLDK